MAYTFSRRAGVLMHIASLPGPYGIGTLGQPARDFVDMLAQAGQSWWQILPICPTGYGNSPYQSFSAFAGNTDLIDPALLYRAGWLTEEELTRAEYTGPTDRVDYAFVQANRRELFSGILERFRQNPPADFDAFCRRHETWLEDYALFMAVKDAHDGLPLERWERDIRLRRRGVVAMWRVKCARQVAYYKMVQYFFFTQWENLKAYANKRGIGIIGDIPIYVSGDSADVWVNANLFDLDSEGRPREVAGCPPDAFSDDGQLWGNPVYNWRTMRLSGYRFWVLRLAHSLHLYDALRIDHFRGFASYYCIPAGAANARVGIWRKGPGMALWRAVRRHLGEVPIIAEDLGFLTPEVERLLADSGFPGMKVLQFAFTGDGDSDHLPHRHTQHSVVYTGTHDNDTLLGWLSAADDAESAFARRYLRVQNGQSLRRPIMAAALASVAHLCVLTMQDILGLGTEARMNVPSTVGENWLWRATEVQLKPEAFRWLREQTALYGRLPNKE